MVNWSKTQEFLNDAHREIYDRTKDIPGWQMPGDSLRLFEMAYHAGDVILEIGTFGGRSAVVEILGALSNQERCRPPQLFGIDIDIHGIWRTQSTLDQFGLNKYALLFHGNLDQFRGEFAVSPTMVFVDGDHRYQGVRHDLHTLLDFLAPATPVLCHDYTNPENDTGEIGVRRAVDEFVTDGNAELVGVFGCSAFLLMSERARGLSCLPWSCEEFAERRAEQMARYAQLHFAQLQQTTSALERMNEVEAENARLRNLVRGMESSKFWKLRTAWKALRLSR